MARSENQGLQIALIVFVMLTIVLAVVTFLYVPQLSRGHRRPRRQTKAGFRCGRGGQEDHRRDE